MPNMTSAAILGELIKERYVKRSGSVEYVVHADFAHEIMLESGDRFYVLSDVDDGYHGQPVLAVRPEYFYGGFYHRPFKMEVKGDARTFTVITNLDDIQLPILLNHTEAMALVSAMEDDVFPEPLNTKTLSGVTSVSLSRFQAGRS